MTTWSPGFSPFVENSSLALTSSPAPTQGGGNYLGLGMSIAGALSSMISSFYAVKSTKSSLKFQSQMNAINARMAEKSAQDVMRAAEQEQGRVSMYAGKVKGAQRASQGARGVVAGVGSAAEEVATTDLIKEMDMHTINANAVRRAWAVRMHGVNFSNESLLQGTYSGMMNPYMAAGTSLLQSGSLVAASWYQHRKPTNSNPLGGF